jgi:hypothetical protein
VLLAGRAPAKRVREVLSPDALLVGLIQEKIRAKIKRLLRKHAYQPRQHDRAQGGGAVHGLDHAAQLILDQAKALYRYWPEVEVGDRLFL